MPRLQRYEFPDVDQLSNDAGLFFKQLPILLANMTLNFIDDRWKRQGWTDDKFEKWKPRSKKNKSKRAILTKTGRLRRSISAKIETKGFTIYTNLPYAQIHNEGGDLKYTAQIKAHNRVLPNGKKVKVRAHPRKVNTKIDQRQFMPVPGEPLPHLLRERMILHIGRVIQEIKPK